ncbi:unnamed protein product, partial [Didymodactylos carnosus]
SENERAMTVTMTSSDSVVSLTESDQHHVVWFFILTCLFLIIACVGIIGNVLVILSVHLDSRMRRSLTNRLIVHVACCDLIILLFNIPDIVQFVSSRGNWILTVVPCKLVRSTLVLAQYASVLTMCAVTIERFIGIVYPLRSKFLRERKHVAFIMIGVWLFSLCCCAPNLIYLTVIHHPNSTRSSCALQFTTTNSTSSNCTPYIIYKSLESCFFYFIPLLLQLYCYTKIAKRLFNVDEHLQVSFRLVVHPDEQNKLFQLEQSEMVDNDDDDGHMIECEMDQYPTSMTKMALSGDGRRSYLSSYASQLHLPLPTRPFASTVSASSLNSLHQKLTNDQHSHNPNSTNLRYFKQSYTAHRTTLALNALRSRRNVIKMLIIVIIIYFISFSPQVLAFLLFDTGLTKTPFVPSPHFIAFTFLLVCVSSASNPIVYVIFCSKFRTSFLKIIKRLFVCRVKRTSLSLPTTSYTCCGCLYFQRGNGLTAISGSEHFRHGVSPPRSTIYHFHDHNSKSTNLANGGARRAFPPRTAYKFVRNG